MYKNWKVGIVCALAALLCGWGFFYGVAEQNLVKEVSQRELTEGWVHYDDPEGRFSVAFPSAPVAAAKKLIVPSASRELDYNELTSYRGAEERYSVTYVTLPRKWMLAGGKKILKVAFDVLIKNVPETEVLYQALAFFERHRCIEFQYKRGETIEQGRLILIGNTLYKLSILSPQAVVQDARSTQFLDSFRMG
jgi:hypothetical protein